MAVHGLELVLSLVARLDDLVNWHARIPVRAHVARIHTSPWSPKALE